jgi:threonine/homoserine/homoserine lactone efflux protein
MILYILLHVFFGIVAGATFIYLRRTSNDKKRQAWTVYVVGIFLCFSLLALIGQYSVSGKVEEVYDWISMGFLLLAFIAVLVIFRRAPH